MAEIRIRTVIIDIKIIIIKITVIAIDTEAIAVVIIKIIKIKRVITPLKNEKIRINIGIKNLKGTLA